MLQLYCVNMSYYYCVNMASLKETYFILLIPTLVKIFKIVHSRKFWKVRSVFSHIVRRDTLRTIRNNYDI
jgi:hypothetical protein